MVTLGVADLDRATRFYEAVLRTPANCQHDGIRFFEMPGIWLSLYPRDKLAEDISPTLDATPAAFSGMTIAYNARSQEEVSAIMQTVSLAGGRIAKPEQETFWGGFSGYFADPDGYYWEVAWGPMFEFDSQGGLLPAPLSGE
ncbi:VOC family protein [Parachitinimonas caeni]|uniref:VOC family protein n=1 Tax=Parachitinimonas caeni TaxID=3031301 RepID=A0ABT7DYA6_9NEIS|nr:VOC family protein [Parachitinimonas caeni]MDK2123642.1 VOC family protein [Parachitinimonas caeni]